MFRLYLSVVLVAVKDAGEWVEQSKKKHRNVTRWIWAEFKEAKWSDSGNGGKREGSEGWSMETWMLCVCWAQSHKSVVCWGPRGDGMAAYCCGWQISGMSHEDFSIWHSTEQKREPGLCCLNRGRSVSPGVSRPVCAGSGLDEVCALHSQHWFVAAEVLGWAWSQGDSHSLGFPSFSFPLQKLQK